MKFKDFIAEDTPDPKWTRVKDDLDDDIKSSPKLMKLAKFICDSALHDGEDPTKVIKRMSGGSKRKALKMTVLDNMTAAAKEQYTPDEIELVFDHVLAAATGGTEFEWDSE